MFEENWDDPNPPPQPITKSQLPVKQKAHVFVPRHQTINQEHNDHWRRHNNNTPSKGNFGWGRQKNKLYMSPKNHKITMRIEDCKTGKLIGKLGANLKEMEEETGTKITVGQLCEDDIFMREVTLTGETETHCLNCKLMIEERLGIPRNVRPRETSPIDWDALNKISEKAEAEKWAKCPPIKKNFYIEHPEISSMTEDEAQAFREARNNIMVNNVFGGEDKIEKPVKTFAHAFENFPDILKLINEQNFQTPSPIQCQAWPILLSGKDLIGIAQTGTGKTLAFILPALIHIEGQDVPKSKKSGPNVLVVAPTRELALQIEKEVQKYSYRGFKSVCVYGGGGRRDQINAIGKGVEIVIATPGRLIDLIEAGAVDLTSVTYMVLDEADRMLDMGFEPQIRKILLYIRPDRQSVMTSATWPERIQSLAQKYMSHPVQVIIGSLDLTAAHSVSQTVLVVQEHQKLNYLMEFISALKHDDKMIVFVSKKVTADHLSADLSLKYILCNCIHGNRDQIDREQALEDLRTGIVNILIATDLVSRGIDICDITKVFNYDFPKNIEEYVHRVGRTGRAGKKGEAITLFTQYDAAFAAKLIAIMEEAEQPVPEELHRLSRRHKEYSETKRLQGGNGRRESRGGGAAGNKWRF